MIIAEKQLKVPGKIYQLEIHCVSTQRPTTMEWLILTCVDRFGDSPQMKDETLKYAFEEVFRIPNSQILIGPPLKHLRELGVIEVNPDIKNYGDLQFGDIRLSQLGRQMLREGAVPGQERTLALTLHYNPLTGQMNEIERSKEGQMEQIPFGKKADYSQEFPRERILQALQKGEVGNENFSASKLRITQIECREESPWPNCYTTITLREEGGILKTQPEILEKRMKEKIGLLFLPKEMNQGMVKKLPPLPGEGISRMIGSGSWITKALGDVLRGADTACMDEKFYQCFEDRWDFSFPKVLILFGASSFGVKDLGERALLFLPEPFPVETCAAVNEKGGQLCLGKETGQYEGKRLEIPLAYEDRRLRKRGAMASWLSQAVRPWALQDPVYSVLYTLPLLEDERQEQMEHIYKRWESCSMETIIEDMNAMSYLCAALKTQMFQFDGFEQLFFQKLKQQEKGQVMGQIQRLLGTDCVNTQGEGYMRMLGKVLQEIAQPDTYDQLLALMKSLGVKNHEDALKFDDLTEQLYNRDVIVDILGRILKGNFKKLPELFELDVFFNSYWNALERVQILAPGLDLFAPAEEGKMEASLKNCPDLAGLRDSLMQIRSKHGELIRYKVNVYEEMKGLDLERAEAFFDNLNGLEELATQQIEGVIRQKTAPKEKEEKPKGSLYVLDTCALMHEPELFCYFRDDEYIRIPVKVIEELDKIKDKRSRKAGSREEVMAASKTAGYLLREIGRTYSPLFNRQDDFRFLQEFSDESLLPKDLDPESPDNRILSVALKYRDWQVTVLTDDNAMANKARILGFETLKAAEFMESHRAFYKSLEARIKEANLKKKEPAGQAALKAAGKPGQEKRPSQEKQPGQGTHPSQEKQEEGVAAFPITSLKPYLGTFEGQQLAFLQNNGIKTIGDLKRWNPAHLPMGAKEAMRLKTAVHTVLLKLDGAIENLEKERGKV